MGKKYHKLVWQKAKTETESYFRQDRWSWIGGGIAAIVSGVLATYIQIQSNETVMAIWWLAILSVVAGTVLGLSVFVIALYMWNGIWAIPERMYQEKEANYYTWNDV